MQPKNKRYLHVVNEEAGVQCFFDNELNREMTREEIIKAGLDYPMSKEELKWWNEAFKDYPFKADATKIDPKKIIDKVNREEKIWELISTLGEPIKDNGYIIEPDDDGKWWITHKHVGSGEPLFQWINDNLNLLN